MSRIKRAIEEIQELGWTVDNNSLRKLVKLRKEKEKENGADNRNKEKRKNSADLPG